jgi:hypothetical protein
MKEKEIKFINSLNKKFNKNLVPSKDTFDVYDAYNENSIIEIKIRDKTYDTKFLQVDKCYQLLMVAEANGKRPFYVVRDPGGVYVFDLLDLKDNLLKKQIVKIKSPYSTEFTNNILIDKYFYELKESEGRVFKN